jgi:hypothetical protein
LLQQVADFPLCRGITHVERVRVDLIGRALRAKQRGADLRAVAVRDDDLVPGPDDLHHGFGRSARVHELLGDRAFLTRADERVAANGDESGLRHDPATS